jgi:rare lipoprotein A
MRWLLPFALSLLVAACASQPKPAARAPALPGVKIGKPYQVFGRTHVPRDDRGYQETGIASWYGPNFHARPTANGEIYNQDDLTAAHRTLPMPSWVEVTNLDNGRQLTVRINDRGPFVGDRIIDLSRRSAQLLGVDGPGLARVRVRRVYPPEDWARTTPPRPVPVAVAPVPAPLSLVPGATNVRWIQVAALSDEGRARALASVLGDYGPAFTVPTDAGLWRVRIGPLTTDEAMVRLARVRDAGYADARLLP